MLFFFTDFVDTVEEKTFAGWIVINLALLVFSVNGLIYLTFISKWIYLLFIKLSIRVKYMINKRKYKNIGDGVYLKTK